MQHPVDELLAKIDKAVGPPETETPEEREKRKQMLVRNAEARRIRKASSA